MPSSYSRDDTLRVAAVQMNSQENKAANIETALDLIDRAAGTGARLIALPEVWTYLGATEGNYDAAETVPGPTLDRLADRARRHGVYLHAGSIYERIEGEPRLRNTSAVFDPDGNLVATYRKMHLFDVVLDGVATYRESETVAAGEEISTVNVDGVTVGLAICYDLRFPELFRLLALQGAELIILPAAFTMTTGKDHWEVLIRARAIENGVYMIAPAQLGQHPPGNWSYGRSLIVDPWGTTLATAPDAETVITAELDLSRIDQIRRQIPSLANRMPEHYQWPEGGAGVGAKLRTGRSQ